MRSAACGPGPPLVGGPNSFSVVAYRPNCELYCVCMLLMVWISRMTAISLAFILALPSLGTAMARMIRMIAITINISISEQPRLLPPRRKQGCFITLIMTRNVGQACKGILARVGQVVNLWPIGNRPAAWMHHGTGRLPIGRRLTTCPTKVLWIALAMPLGAHMVSMGTGELKVDGNRAPYELRLPAYEVGQV